MESVAGFRLFLLGFAAGLTTLTMSAYRRVSPRWLRWLLLGSGLLMLGRYLALAMLEVLPHPPRGVLLHAAHVGSVIGLTLPSVFAIDQLLRHPALSPKTLLRWYAPFAILVSVSLSAGFVWGFVVWSLFAVGFVAACLFAILKFPVPAARSALLGLVMGYLGWGLMRALPLLGVGSLSPYFLAELPILLALWHAYETSTAS